MADLTDSNYCQCSDAMCPQGLACCAHALRVVTLEDGTVIRACLPCANWLAPIAANIEGPVEDDDDFDVDKGNPIALEEPEPNWAEAEED